MSKTLKVRKSPSYSATKFAVGTKKKAMMVICGKQLKIKKALSAG